VTIKYLTDKEVAEMLRFHLTTIRDWAIKGKIPGEKVGRNWMFKESNILRWIARQSKHRSKKKGK
jgi:excisionase family DNA binding protein